MHRELELWFACLALTNGLKKNVTRDGRILTFSILQMQIPARTSVPDRFEEQSVFLDSALVRSERFWFFILWEKQLKYSSSI